jgi:hypothetical protein
MVVGSSPDRVEPNTIKLVFVASQLSTQHFVILQFPNNLTCKISVLVSIFCTHCKNVVHAWIDF